MMKKTMTIEFDPRDPSHREGFRKQVGRFGASPESRAVLIGLLDYIDELEAEASSLAYYDEGNR
jgi:hypothetical protein